MLNGIVVVQPGENGQPDIFNAMNRVTCLESGSPVDWAWGLCPPRRSTATSIVYATAGHITSTL